MTSVLKEVIKYVAALMSFCTLIYLIVIVLDWFSLTNPLDSKNPVTIYGYTCFAHLLSIPMLLYAVLKYKFNYLFPFILVNFFWITIIVTLTTLIYTGVCKFSFLSFEL